MLSRTKRNNKTAEKRLITMRIIPSRNWNWDHPWPDYQAVNTTVRLDRFPRPHSLVSDRTGGGQNGPV
jgi:hypothetical protein